MLATTVVISFVIHVDHEQNDKPFALGDNLLKFRRNNCQCYNIMGYIIVAP